MAYAVAPVEGCGAYFGPLAVALLIRHCTGDSREPVDLDELAARYERVGGPAEAEAARQLRMGLRMARISERLRKGSQAGRGSVEASSVLPKTGGVAGSVACPPPGSGEPRWLSVSEVAEKLGGCSRRHVTGLCSGGVFSVTSRGQSRGRPWLVAEGAVEEYLDQRGAR